MRASCYLLLMALLLGGCSQSPEERRAKAFRARDRAIRKQQEKMVPGQEGEQERVAEYREARQIDRELKAEAKAAADQYAREHPEEIAQARTEAAEREAARREFRKNKSARPPKPSEESDAGEAQ